MYCLYTLVCGVWAGITSFRLSFMVMSFRKTKLKTVKWWRGLLFPLFQNNEGEKGGKGSFECGAVRGSRCSGTQEHRQEGGKFILRSYISKHFSKCYCGALLISSSGIWILSWCWMSLEWLDRQVFQTILTGDLRQQVPFYQCQFSEKLMKPLILWLKLHCTYTD